MDEMLDVVDGTDTVIRQETRSRIHEQQLMHRATHILLTDSSGRIYVQLRSKSKDTNPGLWDTSAAGHVDAGESYIDCAVRELSEELGVVVKPEGLHECGRLPPTADNGFEFVRIYVATSDDDITLEAGEIDDGRWLSHDELNQQLKITLGAYTSTFVVIWKIYLVWLERQTL